MNTAGIIAEYNPFHKGHEYQIQALRNTYRPDYVIIAMSGNFLQRGTPALLEKYTRAKMALLQGADLVLELPACFATASAELFALGSVLLFHTAGLVDSLCFGVESEDFQGLLNLARLFADEPKSYRDALLFYLKQGDSFPVARAKALPEYAGLLDSPNNILAVEYCKALLTLNSSITPVPILRKGSGYHDTDIHAPYASASAIRNILRPAAASFSWKKPGYAAASPCTAGAERPCCTEKEGLFPGHSLLPELSHALPDESRRLMEEYLAASPFLWEDDFSLLLHHRLLQEEAGTLLQYGDMTTHLANRIFNQKKSFRSWSSFCETLHTKNLTYSRASRVLTHILLNIKQEQISPFLPGQGKRKTVLPYLRVLGFSKAAAPLLTELNAVSKAPVLTSPASAEGLLDPQGLAMLRTDLFAADIYRSVRTFRTGQTYPNEYERRLLVC